MTPAPSERSKLYALDGKRVWVAGHQGMVGSAIARRLEGAGCEIQTADRQTLDLRDGPAVLRWMQRHQVQAVFVAAAKVGGIHANATYPASFLYDNLMIEANVIDAAYRTRVEKLLFLGSSCIYPRAAPQPIAESALLSGPLEPTNEWYAIAKIAGVKLAQAYRKQYGCDFISAMPTNLYGPGDNFDLSSSHVIPALMHKAHLAKLENASRLTIWGSGAPRREFLHADDCADALVHLMEHYSDDLHVNVGVGEDMTIAELAAQVADVVGFHGQLEYDRSKADGAPRKVLDVDLLRSLGWTAKIDFRQGLEQTYAWFLENVGANRPVRGVVS